VRVISKRYRDGISRLKPNFAQTHYATATDYNRLKDRGALLHTSPGARPPDLSGLTSRKEELER
jgi:hypothetical protein